MASGGWGVPYNPYYEPRRRRFGTTPTELFHITAAMLILSATLFLVLYNFRPYADLRKGLDVWGVAVVAVLVSFFGFVLHELGHKFTAQHFGYWSEFRANWPMLALGFVVAYVFQLIFAAPGATWHNAHGKAEQGKISAMGPLVNLVIAVIAVPLTLARTVDDPVVNQLAGVVVLFSSFLALFNLIPFGPLDGRKIIAWNPLIWGVMAALALGLFLLQSSAQA